MLNFALKYGRIKSVDPFWVAERLLPMLLAYGPLTFDDPRIDILDYQQSPVSKKMRYTKS